MATNYSSPTANLFDLLKPEDDKKSKQPTKQPAAKPGKKMTPEEKSKEEAEKQRQVKEAQKMEAALVNQHEEEARDQGFKLNAPTTSGKATTKTSHLSRAEWEAKKAKGEALSAPDAQPEPQQQQVREPRNNNNNNYNNNRGNRNFDNPSEIKEQRQPNNRNFDRQHQGDNQERRGPKPGREHDRHSQAQTGRKFNEKRGGGGKFNLGNATEPVVEPVAEQVVDESEKTNAVVSEPASTDASAVSTAVDEKKVQVIDPEDEGYGKITLAEYEQKRIAEAEALAKIVGTVERRELDKKIDLSKCIEADKHDDKYSKHTKARTQPSGNAAAKPKAKTVDLNEFVKTEGGTPPQLNQPRRGGPHPGNKNMPRGRNQFPAIGEEPQPRSNQGGYRSEQSENHNWNNNNNGSDNNNGQKTGYQGQNPRPNRPPRQQGQGVQQGQGSQQPQGQQGPRQGQQGQGQRQQGQGNRQQGQGQRQGQGQGQQFRGNNQGQRSQGTA
jgi:hypothetical protein